MITSIINFLITGIGTAAAAAAGALFENLGLGLAQTEALIPGLSALDPVFVLIGAVTAVACFYARLTVCVAGPAVGIQTEHPAKAAGRAVVAAGADSRIR